MNIEWEPFWYELDQSIVVGDIDFFYLTKDKSHFAIKKTIKHNEQE